MKVVILGATGGTGLEIVRQAIGRGHSVTAFVRSPEKLRGYAGVIRIEQGSPLDTSERRKSSMVKMLFCRHLDRERLSPKQITICCRTSQQP
jgi:putative NADH-flavin reductase